MSRMQMYSSTAGQRPARPSAAPPLAGTGAPDVPDEVLRDFYRSELDRSSFRRIEDRIGVGRTTLAKFLQGSQPTKRIKRQLTAGYLGETDTDHHRGALVLLVGHDVRMQEAATRALVDVYRTQGHTAPSWLTRLHDRFVRRQPLGVVHPERPSS